MDEAVAVADRKRRALRVGVMAFCVAGVLGACTAPFLAVMTAGCCGVSSPYEHDSFLLRPAMEVNEFVKLFVGRDPGGMGRLLAVAFIGYGILGCVISMLGWGLWRVLRRPRPV